MNRAERDGYQAAADIAQALGLACEAQRSGKHLIAAVSVGDSVLRIPVSGSPGHGQGGSAFLVRATLRKRLRQMGIAVA